MHNSDFLFHKRPSTAVAMQNIVGDRRFNPDSINW